MSIEFTAPLYSVIQYLQGVYMSLKSNFTKCLSFLFRKRDRVDRERSELNALGTAPSNADTLRFAGDINLTDILNSPETESTWMAVQQKLSRFDIVDGTGGVNPGDRRAIYYLTRHLRPQSVLEVGTHIGTSTLHIASALSVIAGDADGRRKLLSVDINDVNNIDAKPWLNYGSASSPAEMMREMNFDSFVEFITKDSYEFLTSCSARFDLIFLDGDHAARTVYREIPAALKLLNPGGIILLHDYFPDLKPLWNNGSLIPGPCLAIERLCNEGARLRVLPLGELPWPTKLGSRTTSLALLLRDQ